MSSSQHVAGAVSRVLNANGLRTLPSYQQRSREGIFVRRAGAAGAAVTVDIDGSRDRDAVVDSVTELLQGKGYVVDANPACSWLLYVAKAAKAVQR